MNYTLPGSTVHGILWSRLLCPPPGDPPDTGIASRSPSLKADSLLSEPPGNLLYLWLKSSTLSIKTITPFSSTCAFYLYYYFSLIGSFMWFWTKICWSFHHYFSFVSKLKRLLFQLSYSLFFSFSSSCIKKISYYISLCVFWYVVIVIQSLSRGWLFVTPRTGAHQASLSITISQSLLKLMSIELMMLYNHLILCHFLLLLPSTFPSIRVFSNELALCITWAKVLGVSAWEWQTTPGFFAVRTPWKICSEMFIKFKLSWITIHVWNLSKFYLFTFCLNVDLNDFSLLRKLEAYLEVYFILESKAENSIRNCFGQWEWV